MSPSRLRVGVVGMGVMGRHHVRILSELSDVQLVAVCDPDAGALEAARSLTSAELYASVADLSGLSLDLVVVAVPTSRHREVASQLWRPGITVVVEKPLASTVADGEHMIQEARRVGARLGVGHVERFNPVVVAAGELLRSGRFGRPVVFGARRLGPLPPRVVDVGVTVDLATHDIDVITSLHQESVLTVQAQAHRTDPSRREDAVIALIRFADGVSAIIEANWITPTKVRELSVTCDAGMFIADYLSQEVTLLSHAATVEDLPLRDVQTLVERRTVDVALVRAEPLRRELEAFTGATRDGRPLPVTGEVGLAVLKLAAAIQEAASSGATVPVSLYPANVP